MVSRCKVPDARLSYTRAQRQREYSGRYVVEAAEKLPDCHDMETLNMMLGSMTVTPVPADTDSTSPVLRTITVATPPDSQLPDTLPTLDATGTVVSRRRRNGNTGRNQSARSVRASTPTAEQASTAGQSIGTIVRNQPRESPTPRQQEPQATGTSSPAQAATTAARRYRQTLAAHAALAADSDDEEPDAASQSIGHQDVDMDAADSEKETHDVASEQSTDLTQGTESPALNALDAAHGSPSETQPSNEPYYHATSPDAPSPMETDEVVAKTPSVPDDGLAAHGFEMGEVVVPTNTYNLTFQEWIGSVAGVPVTVPANGQCLFLAFHASTENTQVHNLHLTPTIEAKANVVKKQALDIVLANLRYDVKLELVDPKTELQRMYPGENPPSSVEAAVVALFAHYLKIRDVSVATPVPKTFWEGPHVLRAMAVYLREPIYVWDIAENDIAHAQQYSFKTFEMANSDRHETGVVAALPDDTVRDILEECFNQQVIPVMLLLKHSEGHFYGVQHGQTFIDWHTKSAPEMRSRLDAVHEKFGMPIMPGNGYDPESVAVEVLQEEQGLLEEMGVDYCASGSQASAVPDAESEVKRVEPTSTTRIHRSVYERILRTADANQMDTIDSRIAARLHQCNDVAFQEWLSQEGPKFKVPQPEPGQRPWVALIEWLVETPLAIRHVLAYLTFPEIAIQCDTTEQIGRWGEWEAYHHQLQTLERLWTDDESDDRARELCYAWIQRCKQATATEAFEMARNRSNWEALGKLVDESLFRVRPLDIPLEHWFIMHVLPFTVANWSDTAMGRVPPSARTLWYNEYSQLQQLCTDIADRNDWSKSIWLSLGVARTEALPSAAEEARGVSSPAHKK